MFLSFPPSITSNPPSSLSLSISASRNAQSVESFSDSSLSTPREQGYKPLFVPPYSPVPLRTTRFPCLSKYLSVYLFFIHVPTLSCTSIFLCPRSSLLFFLFLISLFAFMFSHSPLYLYLLHPFPFSVLPHVFVHQALCPKYRLSDNILFQAIVNLSLPITAFFYIHFRMPLHFTFFHSPILFPLCFN